MTARTRGVTLTRLDFRPPIAAVRKRYAIPADATLTLDYTYALARAHGRTYVLCHEGVGWDVTDEPLELGVYVNTPGREGATPLYRIELTRAEVEQHEQPGQTVDLADFVRTFGDRLETNFRLWHRRLTEPYQPAGPRRRYRTIRGPVGKNHVAYYTTRARRDAAAQRDADRDGEFVLAELWSEEHPQDALNLGWGCDLVAVPGGAPCAYCGRYTEPNQQAAARWQWPGRGLVTNCKSCAGIEACPRCGVEYDNSEGVGACPTCLT